MTSHTQTYHRPANECFSSAIDAGILSANPIDSNYAGNYMYMHSTDHADHFKHHDTREYIQHDHTDSLATRIRTGRATFPCASILDN